MNHLNVLEFLFFGFNLLGMYEINENNLNIIAFSI